MNGKAYWWLSRWTHHFIPLSTPYSSLFKHWQCSIGVLTMSQRPKSHPGRLTQLEYTNTTIQKKDSHTQSFIELSFWHNATASQTYLRFKSFHKPRLCRQASTHYRTTLRVVLNDFLVFAEWWLPGMIIRRSSTRYQDGQSSSWKYPSASREENLMWLCDVTFTCPGCRLCAELSVQESTCNRLQNMFGTLKSSYIPSRVHPSLYIC